MRQDENMNIVIVGHVDHGKSTIIGRLLADTDSLPKGKLESVQENCRRNSKPFEYAFLLDALKDEQAQGITIDAARVFFNTELRKYIILDAPGHIEFLKNMVTGAARAEAALLVIDANEGVMENSRRHGYLLSMLGIKQVVVLVNKMDLVDYSQERFDAIVAEYNEFLKELNVEAMNFIPISGFYGDNIANQSENTPWYDGHNVLETLDDFDNAKEEVNQVFRMPVQDVYKFTQGGDDRRIVAGTIDTGTVRVGDEVVFYPSGKHSKVKTIEYFNGDKTKEAFAGQAAGFTLEEQIYITRGELASIRSEARPKVSTRIKAKLFWLGRNDLEPGKEYLFKIGTRKVRATLEEVIMVLDASSLDNKKEDVVKRHEVAECILSLDRSVAFDLAEDLASSSRFVLIDNFEISGGGIIVEALEDDIEMVRNNTLLRDEKWLLSGVSKYDREEQYRHKSALIVITGEKGTGRKDLAKYTEKRLFVQGYKTYYLPIKNVLYGIDSDLTASGKHTNKEEHVRRLAEVSNVLLDSGQLLIVTAQDLTEEDFKLINEIVKNDHVVMVERDPNKPIVESFEAIEAELINGKVFVQ